jgi:hypothetical protein
MVTFNRGKTPSKKHGSLNFGFRWLSLCLICRVNHLHGWSVPWNISTWPALKLWRQSFHEATSNTKRLESHFIPCESTGFIWKEEIDLAKFLDNTCLGYLSWSEFTVRLFCYHSMITTNIVCLDHFHELKRNDQWNRDKSCKKQKIPEKRVYTFCSDHDFIRQVVVDWALATIVIRRNKSYYQAHETLENHDMPKMGI